jgi:hypothetical protein
MRRILHHRWMLPLTLILPLCGCPLLTTLPDTITDPPGTAPELAGDWIMTGSVSGAMGTLTIDATGDPVTVTGNPDVTQVLGAGPVTADGTRRTAANGLQYIGTGQAVLSGDQLTISIDLTVFAAGFQIGSFTLNYTGTLTDPNTAEGDATIRMSLPGQPSTWEESITATRGGS